MICKIDSILIAIVETKNSGTDAMFISGSVQDCHHRTVEPACVQAPDCRIVLLVGLSLMVVPVVVMCCFNDDRSLGESSEAKRYTLCTARRTVACCHAGLPTSSCLRDCTAHAGSCISSWSRHRHCCACKAGASVHGVLVSQNMGLRLYAALLGAGLKRVQQGGIVVHATSSG